MYPGSALLGRSCSSGRTEGWSVRLGGSPLVWGGDLGPGAWSCEGTQHNPRGVSNKSRRGQQGTLPGKSSGGIHQVPMSDRECRECQESWERHVRSEFRASRRDCHVTGIVVGEKQSTNKLCALGGWSSRRCK